VSHAEFSDARKAAAVAASSGVPRRLSGWDSAKVLGEGLAGYGVKTGKVVTKRVSTPRPSARTSPT